MTVSIGRFEYVLKSTLDFLGNSITDQLVNSGDAEFSMLLAECLDNVVEADESKKSVKPAIMWEIDALDPSPFDPLYTMQFSACSKTVNDADNYLAVKLASELAEFFSVGKIFPIQDYSVETLPDPLPPALGSIYISSVSSTAMRFADSVGLKFLDITAKVSRAV